MTVPATGSVLHSSAFTYAPASFALSANGGAVAATTTGALPTVNQIRFGANGISGSGQGMWINSFRYVPARLADFQLQALTEMPLVPTLDVNFLNNLYEA
jgi:hypothetical protein